MVRKGIGISSRYSRGIKIRHIPATGTALLIAVLLCCMFCLPQSASAAGKTTLKVRAGFYGGEYHEFARYSYGDMSRMSNGKVYTYSGLDSGGFVSVVYATGVTLDALLDDCGISRGSVKFFHMSTRDNYDNSGGEEKTTFRADTLLNPRYFYPDLAVNMPEGGHLSGTDISEYVRKKGRSVPGLLALGCTDFKNTGQDEANRIQQGGDYQPPSADTLQSNHGEACYRLVYGQTIDDPCNVQTSDKYVYAVDIQLAGSPTLTAEKKLVSGTKGKTGSVYNVKLGVKLPGSYGYLPEKVVTRLKKDIIDKVKVEGYDTDILAVSRLDADGTMKTDTCRVKLKAKGSTSIRFRYERTEYDGSVTAANASMGAESTGEAPEKKKPDQPGSGSSGGTKHSGSSGSSDKNRSGSSDRRQDSSANRSFRIADSSLTQEIDRAVQTTQTDSAAQDPTTTAKKKQSGSSWIQFNPQTATVDFDADKNAASRRWVAAAAGGFLAAGVCTEILWFRRHRSLGRPPSGGSPPASQ